MLRCFTQTDQRSISYTCMSRVCSLSSLPTLASGSSLLAKTTSSMPGEHLMVLAYFRYALLLATAHWTGQSSDMIVIDMVD